MNNRYLELALKAATAAGNILTDYYNDTISVSKKESTRDIVTEVDKMAEDAIIDILKAYDPDVTIVTEEQGRINGSSDKIFWLIDALDGTVNYVNHIPFFAVSISLIIDGVTQVGVVYAPMTNDIYYGARNVGVFKNQKPIRVNDHGFQNALFSVSFSGKSFDPANRSKEFLLFEEINDHTRGCLRTGSASLNLAFLAEGKFGGCWGKANKLWDIGAGLLLAELAGAKIKKVSYASNIFIYSYLATNEQLFDVMNEKVSRVLFENHS